MITLYQFHAGWGLPNVSPPCMKVETYLRMANLPYRVVPLSDPRKAPKGKLPYIDDSGSSVADSTFILDHLKTRYGDTLDATLNAGERAQATALRVMMEEHLYWCVAYSRWIDDANWPRTKRQYFGGMPPLLRDLVPNILRRKMRRTLYAQGIGRHTAAEIYRLGRNDLTAIATFLGDKSFMLGEQPTSLDATAYACLANIVCVPVTSPLKDFGLEQKNIVDYCARMRSRCFS